MSLTAADFVPIWPELLLLVMVSVILIADLFLRDDQRNGVYVLSLLSLAACAVVTVVSAGSDVSIVMHGMFVDDPMSDALKVMVYLAVGAMLVYSRNYIEVRGMFRTLDMPTYRAAIQRLNADFVRIIARHGSGFAFPSRTVYMAQDGGTGKS